MIILSDAEPAARDAITIIMETINDSIAFKRKLMTRKYAARVYRIKNYLCLLLSPDHEKYHEERTNMAAVAVILIIASNRLFIHGWACIASVQSQHII